MSRMSHYPVPLFDKFSVKFDDFKAYRTLARDPLTPRISGSSNTAIVSGELQVRADIYDRGGEAVVENFEDDYFVTQVVIVTGGDVRFWVRYRDANNGYRVKIKATSSVSVTKFVDGEPSYLGTQTFSSSPTTPYELRVAIWDDSGTDTIDIYVAGTKELTVTDSSIPYGGVAFAGSSPDYDDAKIGYDNSDPLDGDIADANDDIIWSEDFGSTNWTPAHGHAGNMVEDGHFRYVYDAWHRLVKVQAQEDSGAATIQTAEFFADGRRAKKVVTNAGNADGTVVCLYDGQKMIETRDGSGNLYQQFIHGLRYIDEVVMVRVADKGDLYVHQDANWNVIGLTDLGGSLVERYVYTPYGELTVNQETGYGDYDGDGDVDATDRAAAEVGGACRGADPSGPCRILDLDFDNDVDDDDLTLFDALPQGQSYHSGRITSSVDQPFGHQGLLFEPEIGSYQNRARQYLPSARRFLQKDPLGFVSLRFRPRALYWDSMNLYDYVGANPAGHRDPHGLVRDCWDRCDSIYQMVLGLCACSCTTAGSLADCLNANKNGEQGCLGGCNGLVPPGATPGPNGENPPSEYAQDMVQTLTGCNVGG